MPRTYGAAIPSYKLYKKSLAGSHMHKYICWNLHIINMFNVHVGVLFNRNNTIFVRYNLHIQAMKLSLPTLLRTGSNCRYHFSSDKNDLPCTHGTSTIVQDKRIFFLWFISNFWKYINEFVCPPWHNETYFLYIDFLCVLCTYTSDLVSIQNVFSFNVLHVPYYAMWFEWIKELWTSKSIHRIRACELWKE